MTSAILINPFSPLRHVHPATAGRMVFKSGGSAPSDQTVTTSNIPEYAEPYYMAMMDDATTASSAAYTPYGDQRLADQNPDTLQSYDAVRDIALSGVPYLDQAAGTAQSGITGAQGIAGAATNAADYDPYAFSEFGGMQDASGLANPYSGFNAYDYGDPQMWDSQVANQYMSPYIENVLNRQKDRAYTDFDRMGQYRDAEATKAGAFGGSRGAVVDALAQEELTRNMADIDARGLQSAYESAGDMFQSDRNTGFQYQGAQADEYGRYQGVSAEELARTQGISIDEARRIQGMQGDELARVQGAQAGENLAAAQFGTDSYRTALDALGLSGDMSSALAGYGEADRAADIQGAQLLEASGQAQTAYDQAGLDIGYQDFLNQQSWDQDQLSWYNEMLRGLPTGVDQTRSTYEQNSPLKDALGMGISAIGLYNGLS